MPLVILFLQIILDGEPFDQEETICCLSAEASKGLVQMLDIGLFKNVVFIMFVISNFLTSIGFNAPYVYQVDRAVNSAGMYISNIISYYF